MDNLRSLFFWIFDSIKGGAIREHYNEIKFIMENFSDSKTTQLKQSHQDKLLRHAVQTTAFYSKYKNYKRLQDFPVINKNIIRDDIQNFLSSDYSKKKLHKVTTSGSTGTPFSVYWDKKKLLRNAADFIYFYELANYNVGNKLYYLRSWNPINRKSKFSCWLKNMVMEESTVFTPQQIEQFIQRLSEDKTKKVLWGYASSFTAISQVIAGRSYPDMVKSIITGSESLPDLTKRQLKEVFECPVISRYSNIENGLLAQQCDKYSEEFHINYGSYQVEVLSMEGDYHVAPGERGRVVITDLFNYALPMIRYDTGDIAVYYENSECEMKTPVFSIVEGRKCDCVTNTSGELLSAHLITNMMWKYEDIMQFQFIQEGEKTYLIKLNCAKSFVRDNEIVQDYKNILGDDAQIELMYVSEIPLLKSGKRKYIVNNCH